MLRSTALALILAAGLSSPGQAQPQAPAAAPRTSPRADHHAHLLSPAGVERIATPIPETVPVPAEVQRLLDARSAAWNNADGLRPLFTSDAVLQYSRQAGWQKGPEMVSDLATTFGRAYRVTPVAFSIEGNSAHIAGFFSRDLEDGKIRHFGHVLMVLRREPGGPWKIAAESMAFPGIEDRSVITAETLIASLDASNVEKAAVLSTAYWWGSPLQPPVANELVRVRAENDWVSSQVAPYPRRLVGFCSFNPLKDYALAELARCTKLPGMKGLKLHFGNSSIDMLNPEHVARVKAVFRAANAGRTPIVAHLWTGGVYDRRHARAFLDQLLPETPDTVVQIAHFAGGGPGYTDEALAVFAEAIQARDPRTRNLYFDFATVHDDQRPETLNGMVERIRQVGVDRVLYGTDLGPPGPRQSWLTFRSTVALTDAEFDAIANNVAPYLR